MTQRSRKFVGTILTLVLVVVYSVLAGAIYANFLGEQPWWVIVTYFAVAGLAWFFPASWVIRWMAKPDA